jgi:vacuolar-type H+-ATPase subunit E/Vma4
MRDYSELLIMTDSANTIDQMVKMIRQEAKDKAQSIKEDAEQKMHIDKNKLVKDGREKLLKEYEKKRENDAVQMKT